jgi:hypothetical protein
MMRTNPVIAAHAVIAVVLLSVAVAAQTTDAWLGTWKLDVAQSKFNTGQAPQIQTLTIEPVTGGAQKHTFEGTNANGQKVHTERVAKFDGVDAPIVYSGEAPAPPEKRTTAFRRIDDHSFEVINKRDGKVFSTGRIVVSADGKTLTNTDTGTSAQGQPVNSVSVYTKQ